MTTTPSSRTLLPPHIARANLDGVFANVAARFAPQSLLRVSEWAEQCRVISPEESAEHGKWHNYRTPYLTDIMDAFNDPLVQRIDVMSASQLGKTNILFNILGYIIDRQPGPTIWVTENLDMAKGILRERILPMIRDTECLRDKIAIDKAKSKDRSTTRLKFRGGYCLFAGAQSAAPLSSWPIRYILADELDAWPTNVDKQGSPLDIVLKRLTRQTNPKVVCVSSPRNKESSVIERGFLDGTQEHYCFACPECGEYQPPAWEQVDQDTATFICRSCGVPSPPHLWRRQAKWIATHPDRRVSARRRSFVIPMTLLPWVPLETMIEEYQSAQESGNDRLQVFVNTRRAETWEIPGDTLEPEQIATHHYNCDLPKGVLVIVAGVDVQADRLEIEVVGAGAGWETWGVQYYVIPGDPRQKRTWELLDEFLARTYRREDGAVLPIARTCIDTGYATPEVYAYCKPRQTRGIYAVRGHTQPARTAVLSVTRQGKNKDTFVFPVNGPAIKSSLYSRLKFTEHGAGYCHFPRETEFADGTPRGYTRTYFQGLTSEKATLHRAGGMEYVTFVKRYGSIRNEPLDCRVYAEAALHILNPDWTKLAAESTPAPVKPTRRLPAVIAGRR